MKCRKCGRNITDDSAFCNWCGAKQVISRAPKRRGNGQGTVWKTPSGKYKAVIVLGYYIGEDGKRHRKQKTRTFAKKADAVAALPGMRSETAREADMSLHDLYDVYLSSRDYDRLSGSQKAKLGYAWKRWVDFEFRGITTLTVSDIEDAIDDQADAFYAARDMKVLISHLYDIAIKKEIIQINKADAVDLPYPSPKARRECWTDSEVMALWKDYETHPFTGYLLIMCYAGLRFGELAGIRLENIHLDANYMVGGEKTDAGRDREIPIHASIKPIIESIIPGRKRKLLEMNKDNFYSAYWSAIDRAGIRKLPPHTCRHWFFSKMTTAGVQGGLIAEVGGHASYLTTLKNYVRVPLSDKLSAVNSITALLPPGSPENRDIPSSLPPLLRE